MVSQTNYTPNTMTFPYGGKLYYLHLLSKINWMDRGQNYVKLGIKMGQSFTLSLWCDRPPQKHHWAVVPSPPVLKLVMVMWREQMIWCVDYLDSSMGKPTSFSYALSFIMLHKIMIFHQVLLIHADWLAKPCHSTVNLHAFLKRGFGFRIKWVILVICSYDHLI